MNNKILIVLVSCILFFYFGCKKKEAPIHATNENIETPQVEVPYTIIKEEKLGTIKTMIDVRLKSEVNEDTLKKIAKELRNKGRSHFQRVFINYYLPDMEVGKGAWALSHFNPDLEVEIIGLSKDEKAELFEKPSSYEGNLIGRWLDNSPYSGGIVTISKTADNLIIYKKYSDGSESVENLIEKTVNGQKRWIEEGNTFGEYYLLNKDGSLSIYDPDGLYLTLKSVEK